MEQDAQSPVRAKSYDRDGRYRWPRRLTGVVAKAFIYACMIWGVYELVVRPWPTQAQKSADKQAEVKEKATAQAQVDEYNRQVLRTSELLDKQAALMTRWEAVISKWEHQADPKR